MKNNKIIIKIKNTSNIKIIIIIIIIIVKNENVFKNWLRPNFLLHPPKNGGLENLRQPLLCPPDPYAPLNETTKNKLFLKQLRSSYLLG